MNKQHKVSCKKDFFFLNVFYNHREESSNCFEKLSHLWHVVSFVSSSATDSLPFRSSSTSEAPSDSPDRLAEWHLEGLRSWEVAFHSRVVPSFKGTFWQNCFVLELKKSKLESHTMPSDGRLNRRKRSFRSLPVPIRIHCRYVKFLWSFFFFCAFWREWRQINFCFHN